MGNLPDRHVKAVQGDESRFLSEGSRHLKMSLFSSVNEQVVAAKHLSTRIIQVSQHGPRSLEAVL